MAERIMDHEQLKQMIDACRPGRDDLREPEMSALADHLARDPEAAALYERSRGFDSAMTAAFRDAPIPAGLEDRLLGAVGATERAAVEPAPKPFVAPIDRKPPLIFRRRVLAGLAAAATLLIMAGFYSVIRQPGEITPAQLVAQTQDVLDDVDFKEPTAWREAAADASRPFPREFILSKPDAMRRIDTPLDSRAAAYRIPVQNKYAYLLVIAPSSSSVKLGGAPPKTPLPGATGGWKMTAWTANGLVYVLAFEGNLRALVRDRPTA
jgi:hypothetical protein